MAECDLCDINPEGNNTFIDKSKYWTLLVNYMQPTLGSTLIVLNRHVENMAELSEPEYIDHLHQVKRLDTALRSSFNPDKINYMMLANVVTHVHFHTIPRYASSRDFAGETWNDENYGHSPKLTSGKKDQKTLDSIIQILRETLPS